MKALRFFVFTLSAAMMPFSVWAQVGSGISGTAHDFSGIGTPATGLCTFCHTPHKAITQSLLWNHELSLNTFSWTDTATTAGTVYPSFAGDTYQGPTVKCLSCHDGSVAVGDLRWWNLGPADLLPGFFVTDPYQIAPGGDMTGNHPVAMPFPFNNVGSNYNGTATGPGITLADWKADPQTLGIVIYNDDGAGGISRGGVVGQSGIECGSCHDPHNGVNVQGPYFLYGELGGDTANYICIKCHTKE